MKKLLDFVKRTLRDPSVRECLWFCAPALALGLALRIWMTVAMPYGYVQFDSADFVSTPWRLFRDHALSINEKRTFLVPVLYTIPFLTKVPALIVIPLAQHILGLLTVIMAGGLVRLWFARWRWFIVPATIATAVNPGMLWYEHALMAETVYLFCVFGIALAGTRFVQTRSNAAFATLLIALFFTTAARPEGKLYFAFAFLLVGFCFWGLWKEVGKKLGLIAAVFILISLLTRTGQSGQLLLASVLPFAPDHSRVFPDASESIRALRERARALHSEMAPQELTTLEKAASDAAREYFKTHPNVRPKVSDFCQKIAIEAILNKPTVLPLLAFNKFRQTMDSSTSVGFDQRTVVEKQIRNFTRREMFFFLSKGLTGRQIKTPEEAADFFTTHYNLARIEWFKSLDDGWKAITLGAKLPESRYGETTVRGLPLFFLLALLGLLSGLVRPGPMRIVHLSWFVAFAGLWFAVMLTGVVNPRYRYVFEPFCVIYVLLLMDVLWNALPFFRNKNAHIQNSHDRDSVLQRSDHDRQSRH